MKKTIALFLALICLLSLASCFPVDPGYGNSVAWANWSDDPAIADGALNKELLDSDGHLPIFKLDTLADLENFKSTYGGILSLDQSYNEVKSFDEVLTKAQWDREDFFKKNSLLIVYVPANSGSYRFRLFNIETEDNSVSISVAQTNSPENVTDDMAGWFVLVEIEDEEIKNCNSFDASLIIWKK